MSQVNDDSLILPLTWFSDLTKLTDELLQHEINYCNSILLVMREPQHITWFSNRLRLAEEEAERVS